MKNRKGIPMMLIGLLMMIAALLLTWSNLRTEKEAGEAAAEILGALEQRQQVTETPTPTSAPAEATAESAEPTEAPRPTPVILATEILEPLYVRHPEIPMPEVKIDGVYYVGVIEVPALKLRLPVVSEWSYQNLKLAPCRFAGSAYQDNLVIIGHNYDTHFGQLKELRQGDEVIFTDMEKHEFRYVVAEIEVLRPSEVTRLVENDYPLSLLTCTVGGRTRLTLRCDRVENAR